MKARLQKPAPDRLDGAVDQTVAQRRLGQGGGRGSCHSPDPDATTVLIAGCRGFPHQTHFRIYLKKMTTGEHR
jgi:hypothetical protein